MHKNKKRSLFIFGALFLFSLFTTSQVTAQMVSECDDPNDPLGLNCVSDSGLGREDPRIVITKIINSALGLLGLVATVLILYAGFLWMTAGGNEESVAKARKIMAAAVIGLVIVLSAYSISNWVLNNLIEATGVRVGTSAV